MISTTRHSKTGLSRFLSLEQQRDWRDGAASLRDTGERPEDLELRFRYDGRYQKLLDRPQAADVLAIVRLYGRDCIPVPRQTERYYWSVSCLPSTSDRPLVRVNASWMELFTIYADGDGIRARFLLHLSDFAPGDSLRPETVDLSFLEDSITTPEELGCFFPRGDDMFGINARGADTIRELLADARMLRAIRTFNLTHLNRGRNAYQASHCYGVADHMTEG